MNSRTPENIYAILIERIIAGELAPGEPLSEQVLAEQFRVSRTPVREALHRLEQANLITRGPRRVFVVRKMEAADLADLFEAVGEIESALAALSAMRMSEIERQNLNALVDEGDNCGDDAGAYGAINVRFHAAISQGAHNSVLVATLDDLELRTQAWRAANFYEESSRLETSRREHREIAEAIIRRDPEQTRRLMRSHVASSYAVRMDIFARRTS